MADDDVAMVHDDVVISDDQVATVVSMLECDVHVARGALRRARGNVEFAIELIFAGNGGGAEGGASASSDGPGAGGARAGWVHVAPIALDEDEDDDIIMDVLGPGGGSSSSSAPQPVAVGGRASSSSAAPPPPDGEGGAVAGGDEVWEMFAEILRRSSPGDAAFAAVPEHEDAAPVTPPPHHPRTPPPVPLGSPIASPAELPAPAEDPAESPASAKRERDEDDGGGGGSGAASSSGGAVDLSSAAITQISARLSRLAAAAGGPAASQHDVDPRTRTPDGYEHARGMGVWTAFSVPDVRWRGEVRDGTAKALDPPALSLKTTSKFMPHSASSSATSMLVVCRPLYGTGHEAPFGLALPPIYKDFGRDIYTPTAKLVALVRERFEHVRFAPSHVDCAWLARTFSEFDVGFPGTRGKLGKRPIKLQSNAEDAAAAQPPHFQAYPLRPEQLRSLGWMLRQEEREGPFVVQWRHVCVPRGVTFRPWEGMPTTRPLHSPSSIDDAAGKILNALVRIKSPAEARSCLSALVKPGAGSLEDARRGALYGRLGRVVAAARHPGSAMAEVRWLALPERSGVPEFVCHVKSTALQHVSTGKIEPGSYVRLSQGAELPNHPARGRGVWGLTHGNVGVVTTLWSSSGRATVRFAIGPMAQTASTHSVDVDLSLSELELLDTLPHGHIRIGLDEYTTAPKIRVTHLIDVGGMYVRKEKKEPDGLCVYVSQQKGKGSYRLVYCDSSTTWGPAWWLCDNTNTCMWVRWLPRDLMRHKGSMPFPLLGWIKYRDYKPEHMTHLDPPMFEPIWYESPAEGPCGAHIRVTKPGTAKKVAEDSQEADASQACKRRRVPAVQVQCKYVPDAVVDVRLDAHYDVRGGILGDKIGYGKTATTIGLIDTTARRPLPKIPACDRGSFFEAKGTLVIVPSNLFHQWLTEIAKFTCGGDGANSKLLGTGWGPSTWPLKVFAMDTVRPLKYITAADLAKADIVLCSYRLLYSTVYQARLKEIASTAPGPTAPADAKGTGTAIADVIQATRSLIAGRKDLFAKCQGGLLAGAEKSGAGSAEAAPKKRAKKAAVAKAEPGNPGEGQAAPKSMALGAKAKKKAKSAAAAAKPANGEEGEAAAASAAGAAQPANGEGGEEGEAAAAAPEGAEAAAEGAEAAADGKAKKAGASAKEKRAKAGEEKKNMRKKKKKLVGKDAGAMALKFPALEMFYWRRIVFDEFHELESFQSNQQFSLQQFRAHYRWGLTGTPPVGSTAGLIFMASLFRIDLPGRITPLATDLGEWDRDYIVSEAADRFAERFIRQNTAELPHIALEEHVVIVRHTAAERALYLAQAHEAPDPATCADAFTNEEKKKALERLLKLCSHFQAAGNTTESADAECARLGDHKQRLVTIAKNKVLKHMHICIVLEQMQSGTVPHLQGSNIAFIGSAGVDAVKRAEAAGARVKDEVCKGVHIVVLGTAAGMRLEDLPEYKKYNELRNSGGRRGPATLTSTEFWEALSSPGPSLGKVYHSWIPQQLAQLLGRPVPTAAGQSLWRQQLLGLERRIAQRQGSASVGVGGASSSSSSLGSSGGSGSAAGNKVEGLVAEALAMNHRERLEFLEGIDLPQIPGVALLEELLPARDRWPAFTKRRLPSHQIAAGLSNMVALVEPAMDELQKAMKSDEFFQRTLDVLQSNSTPEARSCSVCLEDDIPLTSLAITPCAHTFCIGCLTATVTEFKACSMCRAPLQAKDIAPVSKELTVRASPSAASTTEEASVTANLVYGTKLAAVAQKLRELRERDATAKVILFAQFDDLKNKVAAALTEFGIPNAVLHGSTVTRTKIIRDWQENAGSATFVLLLSLGNAASGTNLTAASHVVFLHPMLAATQEVAVHHELQAIGRCRRFGQKRRTVHVWRFVTADTVEQAISERHQAALWSVEAAAAREEARLQPAPAPAAAESPAAADAPAPAPEAAPAAAVGVAAGAAVALAAAGAPPADAA